MTFLTMICRKHYSQPRFFSYFFPEQLTIDIFSPYSAQVFYPPGTPSTKGFTPISQLNREDADVTLAFLSANSIPFSSPVDDPWYSAHSNPFQTLVNASVLGDGSGTAATGTIYFRDRPVSVLACAEQYQMWTSGPECTPLTGFSGLEEAIGNLSLNDAQLATAEVLLASNTMYLFGVIADLGISALIARNSRASDAQGFLPSN